uniref:Uncharacterized protein n=1 Tax=Arundo donax TaxID=35708 RepID=A0A0A9BPQ8_ARUDO
MHHFRPRVLSLVKLPNSCKESIGALSSTAILDSSSRPSILPILCGNSTPSMSNHFNSRSLTVLAGSSLMPVPYTSNVSKHFSSPICSGSCVILLPSIHRYLNRYSFPIFLDQALSELEILREEASAQHIQIC